MRCGPARYVGALDQGTTSTRFILFDRRGRPVHSCQREHRQLYPRPGWVEHDPVEIRDRSLEVISTTLAEAEAQPAELAALGITNQRETVIVWDRETGEPFGNAVVWQDTRTAAIVDLLARDGGIDRFRDRVGLPLATYFSGPKLQWVLENRPGVREAAERGRALCGTVDSWLIWWLTGGPNGGRHLTDPTNASRTMLMDLQTLSWDAGMLEVFGIPEACLPQIVPSVPGEPYGSTRADGPLGASIPVAGALGDQQAALFGQACFESGSAKNTYGTGCFLLLNTGTRPVRSRHGLITTVAYQLGQEAPRYALEGSIAVTGALVQWLRDNLGLISSSAEIEERAGEVEDSGGVYFVPAFSGLFAPYWRSDARGLIIGLSAYARRGHLARAALEATAFQTLEIYEAMRQETGMEMSCLRVDGGMVVNELLMQFQADLLGFPVVRPMVSETTALGAAFAAGLATGFWKDRQEIEGLWAEHKRWQPAMDPAVRRERIRQWKRAVERSIGWLEKE
ncbi:MAG: glycerol kinase GlpK [Spirochaetales bacterium]|nr:glycerol kinase GlpK [Spirochaetales bacterium]